MKTPDDREDTPVEVPVSSLTREDTGRLRLRLRESIARNESAARSDSIRAGAWDAIARSLDRVRAPRPVVLVVEDDDPTLRGYVRGLEGECDVVACRNVEEGKLAIEKASALDLVILDLALPDGSGYDVAAYLRSTDKFKAVPDVLVISAYVSDGVKRLFSKLPGHFAWIEKVSPERITQIKAAIRPTPIKGTPTTKG